MFWQLCLHVERRLKLVAVAPPLRGLKGPRGTPHKSSAALSIGGGCRAAPLTPPSLRRGFAGSKAKAAAGAAKALPAGARGLGPRGRKGDRDAEAHAQGGGGGGSGCDGRGVPRLSARCSGPARGPPPARPARAGLALAARPGNAPSGSPSPLPPLTPPVSRERLHSIACSWPRSFRRVARLGLSLRASKRSLRVAFGSPPLTIPMGWQDMHCGVQTVVPTVCSSQ